MAATGVRLDEGGGVLVGHGQHGRADADTFTQAAGDDRQRLARLQPMGAGQMRRQIEIAQAEPVRPAQAADFAWQRLAELNDTPGPRHTMHFNVSMPVVARRSPNTQWAIATAT